MYRFYCTVCKKVKRVQKIPVLIENPLHGNPSMRLGECNRHERVKIIHQTRRLEQAWSKVRTGA